MRGRKSSCEPCRSAAVLPLTSETLYEYPILFAHGRRGFRWNAAERKALAEYIENGGFLFADAICASPQFAAAFRREMEAIFPGQKLERIPANHPLFSDEYGGFNLARVTLNDPKLRQEGDRLDARRTQVAPLLEGLQINGRYAVIFSPYDISCALESSTSLECKGYIKTDAAQDRHEYHSVCPAAVAGDCSVDVAGCQDSAEADAAGAIVRACPAPCHAVTPRMWRARPSRRRMTIYDSYCFGIGIACSPLPYGTSAESHAVNRKHRRTCAPGAIE